MVVRSTQGNAEGRSVFGIQPVASNSIREQALGESLDLDKLERLGRYEVHLDRKLERTLAMLLKLKDLRRMADPA